jgi:WD40 repeat protein
VKTGEPIGEPLSAHTEAVTRVTFSPDGNTLASGSGDGTIILWDVKTHQPIGQRLSGHKGPVLSVAFSPDGKTLASGSLENGTIILWDVETHQAIGYLIGHLNFIYSVSFSPDGKTLASGSFDQTVILWDVKTHQPIGQPLNGNQGPVQSVAFSADGTSLAARSANIILWDLKPQSWTEASCQRAGRNFTPEEWEIYFPNEEPRKTCPQFPLELAATP